MLDTIFIIIIAVPSHLQRRLGSRSGQEQAFGLTLRLGSGSGNGAEVEVEAAPLAILVDDRLGEQLVVRGRHESCCRGSN